MTRRVVEKLCAKKVCVDFLAPNGDQGNQENVYVPNVYVSFFEYGFKHRAQ